MMPSSEERNAGTRGQRDGSHGNTGIEVGLASGTGSGVPTEGVNGLRRGAPGEDLDVGRGGGLKVLGIVPVFGAVLPDAFPSKCQ